MNCTNALALFGAWLALISAPGLHAAEAHPAEHATGSISGRVQNIATGAYLEGALVTIEPSRQTTLTERDGSFAFPSLPPGEYLISISYTGLDSQTVPAGVSAGQSLT